jgi:hypothetical protein
MESAAAPVYEALLRGKIPKGSQARADFATFLALMYVRTPAMRRMTGELTGRHLQIMTYAHALDDRAFEKLIADLEEERGQPLDAEMKERVRNTMLDPSGYVLEISKERILEILAVADKLAPIFYSSPATIRWCGLSTPAPITRSTAITAF